MVGLWDLVMVGMCLQVIFMIIIPTKRDSSVLIMSGIPTAGTDDGGGDEFQLVPVWLVIRIIIVGITIKCQMDWKSMHRIANALQDSVLTVTMIIMIIHLHHHHCHH